MGTDRLGSGFRFAGITTPDAENITGHFNILIKLTALALKNKHLVVERKSPPELNVHTVL